MSFRPGNAQHVADDFNGQRGGEITDQVHRPLRFRGVQQPIDKGDETRLQRMQGAWCECGRQQLADPRM